MPTTKNITSKRTIVEYTMDEIKAALGLTEVLAVYIVGGKVEVVTKSE